MPQSRWILVCLLSVLTCACVDDGAGTDGALVYLDLGLTADAGMPDGSPFIDGGTGENVEGCEPQEDELAVHGVFYIDEDESDRSVYTGGMSEGDSPVQGSLGVLGTADAEINTCADGSYRISGLSEGVILVAPQLSDGQRCTTANCPGRFVRAIREGRAPVMVTFGDSIAVVGDAPMFPERVRTLFSGLTDIENRNIAVGGTTSQDWLPDGQYFQQRLAPELNDADLIIVTIGGNDIVQYIGGIGIPNDIPAAVEGARQVILTVIENMREILAAIRAVNADADIAYCLYADYSQAASDPIWGLVGSFIGPDTLADILGEARRNFPTDDPHLVLVDMFGAAQGLPLADYLYDQLHFNDLGQTLYAEEVFKTLGGVLLGPNPLGSTGTTPLGLRRDYGLSPL